MQKYLFDKENLLSLWRQSGAANRRVLAAFEHIPREKFVPQHLRRYAYEDRPLPLLRGKTISQPSTVLMMTQAMEIERGDKILEIGSGSGYQAALLGKLAGSTGRVISCEIIPELVVFAKNNLKLAGIHNVEVLENDGSQGMEKYAPYDKIILTAAAPQFPEPLIKQLKENGVILGPLGTFDEQEMIKAIKQRGKLYFELLGQFLFTPMYGLNGFIEEV